MKRNWTTPPIKTQSKCMYMTVKKGKISVPFNLVSIDGKLRINFRIAKKMTSFDLVIMKLKTMVHLNFIRCPPLTTIRIVCQLARINNKVKVMTTTKMKNHQLSLPTVNSWQKRHTPSTLACIRPNSPVCSQTATECSLNQAISETTSECTPAKSHLFAKSVELVSLKSVI